MSPKQSDEGDVRILAFGFALTILVLLGAAYMAIQAIDQGDQRMMSLSQEQQITDKLIYEIQGEEAGLSKIFDSIKDARSPAGRAELLGKLTSIEADIERTFGSTTARADAERWLPVRIAVERFVAGLRGALDGPSGATAESLDASHEILVKELATLVSANYQNAIAAIAEEHGHRRDRLRFALLLLAAGVFLAVVCAIKTIQKTNQVVRRARWQARELSRLSGHVLESQESVVRKLSRELHDEFGQTLSAIEANLAALNPVTPEQSSRIEDCMLLVQDAMGNVRELSQLLRPSILDDFGLAPGLRWLADSFQQRTGLEVTTRIEFEGRLTDETETHLFRIAQESLTNVMRHAAAKHVELSLQVNDSRVVLTIADDGTGLSSRNGRTGFGLMGMRERMRAAAGELHIRSTPHGVTIVGEVPIDQRDGQPKDTSPVGG
jgi:signal transduction histidine kinase